MLINPEIGLKVKKPPTRLLWFTGWDQLRGQEQTARILLF